jgi:hypothetical protein
LFTLRLQSPGYTRLITMQREFSAMIFGRMALRQTAKR